MEKKAKEARVFLEVDAAVVATPSPINWAEIACLNDAGRKVRAEVILQRPDIVCCLIFSYLAHPDKRDAKKKVEVDFVGKILNVPLSSIRKVILRP